MPGLVPGIHALLCRCSKDVDGRDKPGHYGGEDKACMNSLHSTDLRKVVEPSLQGRVAIVTGAGQGLGRVFAKAFAMAGAIPVIAERNHDKGKAVAAEIGNEAFAIHTDVADPASIDSMVAEVDRRFGRVDVLVNNAGIFSTLEMRP